MHHVLGDLEVVLQHLAREGLHARRTIVNAIDVKRLGGVCVIYGQPNKTEHA